MKGCIEVFTHVFFYVLAGQDSVTLLEPLEAIEGEPLLISCVASSSLGRLMLFENGQSVGDRLMEGNSNTTYQEYILSPTSRNDNERTFICSSQGFDSINVTISIFCKYIIAT